MVAINCHSTFPLHKTENKYIHLEFYLAQYFMVIKLVILMCKNDKVLTNYLIDSVNADHLFG